MLIKIKNLDLHYKTTGTGKTAVILLHGWGHDLTTFSQLAQALSARFTVYSVDLPGFGLSNAPTTVWGSNQYAEVISDLMSYCHLVNPIIIGHSFGGKVALQLANQLLIQKLVLIGSSGVKLPKPLKVKVKIYTYKLMKWLNRLATIIYHQKEPTHLESYRRQLGSADYRQATGIMRRILVKTVDEDLRSIMPAIKVPTLLLWGTQDKVIPLAAGKIMQTQLPKAKLSVIADAGHSPHLDNPTAIIEAIDSFLC